MAHALLKRRSTERLYMGCCADTPLRPRDRDAIRGRATILDLVLNNDLKYLDLV